MGQKSEMLSNSFNKPLHDAKTLLTLACPGPPEGLPRIKIILKKVTKGHTLL